jgi:predicted pyridoxine 5'-phosphate oxidase superfamily flavin-nucleotide-binding protein
MTTVDLEENGVRELIENNALAFSTVNIDGTPNVIGVAFVKVVSSNHIIITDNYMKQTKKNLEEKNAVCLAVWNKEWEGYKLIGNAEYFSEGKWKEFVEKMPENKGESAKGAILITVSELIKLG